MLRTAADGFGYFAVVGEATHRALRKHELTVDDDLEITVRALDQTR
jgi:hypothetical protein